MAKIQIKKSTLKLIKNIIIIVLGVAALILIAFLVVRYAVPRDEDGNRIRRERRTTDKEPEAPNLLYDIEYEKYILHTEDVKSGQTLSHILGQYGVGAAAVDKVASTVRPVFDMRGMRAGRPYTAFIAADSTGTERMCHFVYEKNVTDYIVVSFIGDSIAVREGQKEIVIDRRKATATIESSLWNSMAVNDIPVAVSCELEDIFGWSVDFFSLQRGDKFTVIYDERYIDTVRVGIGRVWGAVFEHNDKTYYAIPFRQDSKVQYWDESGKSLKKQLLKAPLKFSRISSKFSNARLHPILKIYRPHHGVDYAAPAGTPVVAIADGTVTVKGWDKGGGGNMLKIKHANNLTSGYLHLQGYAKGIAVGKRVSQGDVIGYVGSTGRSTGPHLDFRLWKGGTAIDPLKAPSEPSEPIREANRATFEDVRDRVMAELKGEVPDSVMINEI